MRPLKVILAAAFAVLVALPALADAPQGKPVRVRGTVEKLDGHVLTVKFREGGEVKINLAPDFHVRGVAKRKLSELKPNDYVGIATVKEADGTERVVEVHVLTEDLRGRGEGQVPYDLSPNSFMTNATIATVTETPQGGVLKVKYKGEETEFSVGPNVPISAYVPGDASQLKPGAAVVAFALKKEDGSISAANVVAETNGLKPTM